ncbi:hypothetical protein D8674_039118 [Pyrus ussuriensis x Pyrus communis]|uniref:Uncharacterized protein n=1 Tax=Pyrus ussuriensis x Pyrus communis TaxID=2448454 RepID=A0A5N5I4J5_9ROSA|nr:hypothetical protein D8674_039118 [Pyrus ussuriensis x Pyrus communis]
MDLQFPFEVSVSNGVSRFANFDLWVLEEVQKFMGVWREKMREKEEGGKGRAMVWRIWVLANARAMVSRIWVLANARAMVENERNNGGEGEELWNSRVHLSLVKAI